MTKMSSDAIRDIDGLVVGAGCVSLHQSVCEAWAEALVSFGGIYQLKRFLDLGLNTQLIDTAGVSPKYLTEVVCGL